MQVRCPRCNTSIEWTESASSEDLSCTSCGNSFTIKEDETLDYDDSTCQKSESVYRKLSHFDLIEKVGMGAYGTVWKALDPTLDRTVAIKIPRKDQLTPEETGKFLREARAAAQLHHPNIVSVHEVGTDQDTPFIVSDFVQGITLSKCIERKRYGPREAAKLSAKLADALHHAHETGIVHRDLKPANIMIDQDGEPHVMDFGLAKRESSDATITVDGYIMGTPAYMSPEQASGHAHQADRRSDVYSLGVILFSLVTGEKPFRGNARMVLQQVLNDDAPHPRKFDGSIPEDVDTICLKCLEKSPQRRYATAKDLADELRRFLRGEPILSRPISKPERAWRWCKRNRVISSLTALFVVSLVAGLIGVTTQWLRANAEAENANVAAKKERVAAKNERAAHEETERYLYVAHMNMAQQAYEISDPTRMITLLDRHRNSKVITEDPRAFEWYYWWRKCHLWSKSLNNGQRNSPLYAVAITRDGREVVAAGADGAIKIWNTATGELRQSIEAHKGKVFALKISPNGKILASAGFDSEIKLWDLQTGDLKTSLPGHQGSVFSLAFSPDGQTLVSGGSDVTVRVWDLTNGEASATLQAGRQDGHIDFIYCVAMSPDGQQIASAGLDRRIVVWDVATAKPRHTIRQHDIEVWAIAFSPDGKTLASGSGDATIKLWDAETGALNETLTAHTDRVRGLAFSSDGRWLVSGGQDRTVRLWDMQIPKPAAKVPFRNLDRRPEHFFERMPAFSGKMKKNLLAHTGSVNGIAISANAEWIASVDEDGKVLLWEGRKAIELDTLREHTKSVNSISVADNGEVFASASNDRTVRLWSLPDANPLGEPLENPQMVLATAFSPNAKSLAAGCSDGSISLWDVASRQNQTWRAHDGYCSSLAYSPDGATLASGGHDGMAVLWDVATGKESARFKHDGRVYAVKFLANGTRMATACGDGIVRLWDVAADSQEPVALLSRHVRRIWAIAISPDETMLASGGDDKTIKLWDLGSSKPGLELKGHAGLIQSLAFSPDGKTLVSGSGDKTIKLWDVVTGKPKTTLKGHNYRVWSVAFVPDGQTLVSSSYHVKLWRAASRDP